MEYIKNRVSVVITTYKRPLDILKRAVESVVYQTYNNVEIIVVNDSPDFEERDDIKSYLNSKNVKYIENDKSMGAGFSRNRGITVSTGEFIAFLDDDDEWLSDKLEVMTQMFTENVGLVYCALIVDYDGVRKELQMPTYSTEALLEALLYRNFIGGFSGPVLNKRKVVEAGCMDEGLLSSQDADLWRRMAEISIFRYTNKPLVIYYNSNVSITRNPTKRLLGTVSLIKKFDYLYKKYPQARRKHINRCVINYSYEGWYREAVTLIKDTSTGIDKLIAYCHIPLGLIRKLIK